MLASACASSTPAGEGDPIPDGAAVDEARDAVAADDRVVTPPTDAREDVDASDGAIETPDVPIPIFDTALLHARAAVERALA